MALTLQNSVVTGPVSGRTWVNRWSITSMSNFASEKDKSLGIQALMMKEVLKSLQGSLIPRKNHSNSISCSMTTKISSVWVARTTLQLECAQASGMTTYSIWLVLGRLRKKSESFIRSDQMSSSTTSCWINTKIEAHRG